MTTTLRAILGGMILGVSVVVAQNGTPAISTNWSIINAVSMSSTNQYPQLAPKQEFETPNWEAKPDFSLANTNILSDVHLFEPHDYAEAFVIALGSNAAFSAAATITINGLTGTIMRTEIACTFRDGKSRTVLDGCPGHEDLRQAGLADSCPLVAISIPAADRSIWMSSAAKTYCVIDYDDPPAQAKPAILSRDKVKEETIDGHRCTLYRVICLDRSGAKWTAQVWEASDLNNIPVQMILGVPPKTETVQFTQIVTTPPDPTLFEIPAGYKKYYTYDRVSNSAKEQMITDQEAKRASKK